MISTILIGFAVLASAPPAPGPCDFLDRATAVSILGKPVTDVSPSPPTRDEDVGGIVAFCYYRAGEAALIVFADHVRERSRRAEGDDQGARGRAHGG